MFEIIQYFHEAKTTKMKILTAWISESTLITLVYGSW